MMDTKAPAALIVAHGQPSDPAPAAAALAALAARVAAVLPGWHVGSATLAEPDALGAALAAAGPRGLVYPLFMACGWFTRSNLPARLEAAGAVVGAEGWRVLRPFGCDPGVQALTEQLALEAVGHAPQGRQVLVAAHGSFRSPAPALIADAVAARLQRAGFDRAAAAFIDQSPRLAEATGHGPGSVCLPFFVTNGGHVEQDLPAALSEAGFQGKVLPPVGHDARVPGLIAAALAGEVAQPARVCTGPVCGAARLAGQTV